MDPSKRRLGYFFAVVLFIMFMIKPPIDNPRQGFDITFQIGAILILAAFTIFYVNAWAGAWLAWVVVGAFVSAGMYSDYKILYTAESIEGIRAITSGFLIYVIMVMLQPEEKWILNVFCVLLMLHLICQLVQFLNGCTSPGIMYNPNDGGTFAALCSVAFYRPKWKWFFFLPIASVILARSFGGAIGLSLGAICFGFIQNKWVGILSVIIAMEAIYFYAITVDMPGTTRFEAWKLAAAFSFDNKWFIGTGIGNWKVFFKKMYADGYLNVGRMAFNRLHSTWVEGSVEMGVPFVIFCIGFAVDSIRRFSQKAMLPMIGLAVIFGVGLSNSFFKFNQLNGVVAIVWLAMLEIKLRKNWTHIDNYPAFIKQ
jgi:hypothetical protein